jgi:hypothetical protein
VLILFSIIVVDSYSFLFANSIGSVNFTFGLPFFSLAISDYKQSLQFQNLNEEKQNIHLEVLVHSIFTFHLIRY